MIRTARIVLVALLAFAPCLVGAAPPAIRHVFIIVLENENYETSFGRRAPSPYLARTLPGMGVLLRQYYAISHVSLGNYIGMISGQGPNPDTQRDCLVYRNFKGSIPIGSADGQAVGTGCVYPPEVKMIGDQLEEAHLTWRSYSEGMEVAGAALPKTCRHPKLNREDVWQGEDAGDLYATRHVPFVYFHSLIDDQSRCDAHVVDLKQLTADLASAATTPNLVFITPDVCSDGHDEQCADTRRKGGYAGIDDFLARWVPRIVNSPAFTQDGLLLITFDEAELSEASACCNQPGGSGGGRTGAVIVSRYTKPGTVSDVPYNHYSMLRSLEDLFGLPHLGHAAQKDLQAFGSDVYSLAP